MADTLEEEAARCPTCQEPGSISHETDAPPPAVGRLRVYFCENRRCADVGKPWIVQFRPDGTIPKPDENRGPKRYHQFSNDQLAVGQRMIEDIVKRDLRDRDELR